MPLKFGPPGPLNQHSSCLVESFIFLSGVDSRSVRVTLSPSFSGSLRDWEHGYYVVTGQVDHRSFQVSLEPKLRALLMKVFFLLGAGAGACRC